MTQAELEFARPTTVPPEGSQRHAILRYLHNGGRLTVAKAMSELGVYALSQRVGQLKREYGWPIQSRTVQVGPKTYVSEYWMNPNDR